MKHFNILAAILLFLVSGQKMCAQTEHGFREMDIANDFADNPFTFFANAPILAAADSTGNGYNAMTIGWGDAGTLWGKPIMTVYVAQKRYTHEFMERARYFTVMTFDDMKVAGYMGHHSGRDGDKTKALGLHVAYTPSTAHLTSLRLPLSMSARSCMANSSALSLPQQLAAQALQQLPRRHPLHVYRRGCRGVEEIEFWAIAAIRSLSVANFDSGGWYRPEKGRRYRT